MKVAVGVIDEEVTVAATADTVDTRIASHNYPKVPPKNPVVENTEGGIEILVILGL